MSTIGRNRGGFTLLEVIVAIVLIALAGSMLIALVSRSAMGVHRPREILAEAYALQATMENIVARSREIGNDDELSVDDLSTEVGAEGSDMVNDFGAYTVDQNRFVSYDSDGAEVAAGTNTLLKISIENNLGERLTRLFARDS